jgi:hypothetical protein
VKTPLSRSPKERGAEKKEKKIKVRVARRIENKRNKSASCALVLFKGFSRWGRSDLRGVYLIISTLLRTNWVRASPRSMPF